MNYTDYIFTFLLLPAIILGIIIGLLLVCILIQTIIKFNDTRKNKKRHKLLVGPSLKGKIESND